MGFLSWVQHLETDHEGSTGFKCPRSSLVVDKAKSNRPRRWVDGGWMSDQPGPVLQQKKGKLVKPSLASHTVDLDDAPGMCKIRRTSCVARVLLECLPSPQQHGDTAEPTTIVSCGS